MCAYISYMYGTNVDLHQQNSALDTLTYTSTEQIGSHTKAESVKFQLTLAGMVITSCYIQLCHARPYQTLTMVKLTSLGQCSILLPPTLVMRTIGWMETCREPALALVPGLDLSHNAWVCIVIVKNGQNASCICMTRAMLNESVGTNTCTVHIAISFA